MLYADYDDAKMPVNNLKYVSQRKHLLTPAHFCSCLQGKRRQVRVFIQEPGRYRWYLPGSHTQGWKESEGGGVLACGGSCCH